MLATEESILKYIPQRPPMVMVNSLLSASDTEAVTQLTIKPENIFSTQTFSESGLVENIAQTAAAHVGYQCAQKNIPVPIGYIAAVRNLEIKKLPKVNSVITTSIKITNQILDVTVAVGEVQCDGEICCSCEMRIFVKN